MSKPSTAILHYAAPPVIGGVEGVIQAHCQTFRRFDFSVAVIAGRGDASALAEDTEFFLIPEMDTQYPLVLEINSALEQGQVPNNFRTFKQKLKSLLAPILKRYDNLIVHNIFTKHFNIPLTAALFELIKDGKIQNCIAWCHDFTWTSPNSRPKVHEGYPWDLLRTFDPQISYVTVSQERQHALAKLFNCPQENVKVIYNGVDPLSLLGLSQEGYELIQRLNLLNSELTLLMPVRVTQAKNIEYALQLLAELKAKGIRPKLIHTGPPDPHSQTSMTYFQSLQDQRRTLGLEQEMRFVFEAGPTPNQPYEIALNIVGDLYRVSDVMLMPSHREGFGMPVLEAGLTGLPAICTPAVPAAIEIGREDVIVFDPSLKPAVLADQIIDWMQTNPQFRLRQRVRQNFTWEAIFQQKIKPLLEDPV